MLPSLSLLTSDPFAYLQELPSTWDKTAVYDIVVPRKLYEGLGNPQDSFPSIHITGTNGKGTTGAMLAAILFAAGFRVGHTASPHLHEVTERCLVDGLPAERAKLGECIRECASKALELELKPSFFELITGAAFLYFQKEAVDWGVIEVGLGGRLDATNTMHQQKVCVVTSVGLDHEAALGNTEEKIAIEKAGIFREGVPIFVGAVSPAIQPTLKEKASAFSTTIEFYGKDFFFEEDSFPAGEFGYFAPHQIQNAALGIRIARFLGISTEIIRKGLHTMRWPGRLEHLSFQGRRFLLDGAHNPQGMNALREYLIALFKRDQTISDVIFMLSFLAHKNWQEMLHTLESLPISKKFLFTASRHPSAEDPKKLAENVTSTVKICPDAQEALELSVKEAQPNTLIVCAGSLYLLGEIRGIINDTDLFRTIACS